MRETEEIRDRVVLVGLHSPVLKQEENADEGTMEELAALVETAGGEAVGSILQNRPTPDPRTFIGEGKAEEVRMLCQAHGVTMVIFDNDLSPSQQRVLTDLLGVQVLDRCGLILDIFAQRAKTKEGRLQVELAQYRYLLPRLTGMWTHLERQGGSGQGAIGAKGPGETQLETDRRLIHKKIDKLRADLEEVRRVRGTQRQQRQKNEIPVVAIVGYTNAGKSTLLNRLTGAGIPANDRLFDTLDTTSRLLTVSDTLDVVISDTVGFIRKLPHQLVEAFKATLEELEYADLLLHVVDVSNPEWKLQAQVVERLILELGAGELPRIDVYNKSDLVPVGEILPHGEDICAVSARTGEGIPQLLEALGAGELPRIDVYNKSDLVPVGEILPHGEDICAVSARTGEGIPQLLEAIDRRLDKGTRRVLLHLPYDRGGLLDVLYREAKVEKVEYSETIDVTAVCGPRTLGQVEPFIGE